MVAIAPSAVGSSALDLNDLIIPKGAPSSANVTAPVKLVLLTVTTVEAVAPWTIVSAAGVNESE
jgi:hypothetical protein